MATTDSNFVADGGGGATVGMLSHSTKGFIFETGVWGMAGQWGVLGQIDTGSPSNPFPVSTGASYLIPSAVIGATPKVTGVGGQSDTSVGVFGQAGEFPPSLPSGLSCGVLGASSKQPGVMGFSDTGAAGVRGQSGSVGPTLVLPPAGSPRSAGVLGTALNAIGVGGTSKNGIGVLGQTGAKPPKFDNKNMTYTAGVVGTSMDTTGVIGFSQDNVGVVGVSGISATSPIIGPFTSGVFGSSSTGPGVIGTSNFFGLVGVGALGGGVLGVGGGIMGIAQAGSVGVAGYSGKAGPNTPATHQKLADVGGVFGSSDQKAGVVGTSNDSYGVYGFSTNKTAVVGEAAAPAYAGVFFGDVEVVGNLTVTGSHPKGCAVPFPDGTQRVLYCMESPEVWFEDFGTARLKRGRAVVKIDADFAKAIKRGDYRVFVVPEGDCRGLYVCGKGAASFEVRELRGGTSSIAFSYRIVGRRKDVRDRTRFPKFRPPPSVPAETPRARRTGDARSSLQALLAKMHKQAGAKAARRRSHRRGDRMSG
jgi:hypothetical protein